MKIRPVFLALLTAAALTACSSETKPGGDGDASSTSDGSSDSTDSTSGETESSGDSEDDSTDDGGVCSQPGGGGGVRFCDIFNPACSLYAQDCGDGEKCIAPGHCVPVMPGAKNDGEECTKEGDDDNCDKGLVCWDGACLQLCGGEDLAPTCDEGLACSQYFDGDWLPLCRPICDPLDSQCAEGESCVATDSLESYVCSPSGFDLVGLGQDCVQGGGGGTPLCEKGLICVGAHPDGQCREACDLDMPMCSEGECVEALDVVEAAPNVGYCN